jgi:hypothetical protein
MVYFSYLYTSKAAAYANEQGHYLIILKRGVYREIG